MMFSNKKILCISAHMDDVEFGCGGLIKSLEKKSEIYVLVLSKDRKNSQGVIQEIRDVEEQYAAMRILGVKRKNIFISDGIPGQLFPEYRQNVLETMYNIDSQIKPDIVITPSINDVHQDHRIVYISAQKAFKRRTRFAYEIVNASEGFVPTIFVEISEKCLQAKIAAIECFKSQQNPRITAADYFDGELIAGLARMRGAGSGMKYAEAFEAASIIFKQGGR